MLYRTTSLLVAFVFILSFFPYDLKVHARENVLIKDKKVDKQEGIGNTAVGMSTSSLNVSTTLPDLRDEVETSVKALLENPSGDKKKNEITGEEILLSFKFVNPKKGDVLKGKARIQVHITDVSSASFFIQRKEGETELYIGEGKKEKEDWEYMWDTSNTPNGDYSLFIKAQSLTGEIISPSVEVTINNKKEEVKEKSQARDELNKEREEIKKNIGEEKEIVEEKKEGAKKLIETVVDKALGKAEIKEELSPEPKPTPLATLTPLSTPSIPPLLQPSLAAPTMESTPIQKESRRDDSRESIEKNLEETREQAEEKAEKLRDVIKEQNSVPVSSQGVAPIPFYQIEEIRENIKKDIEELKERIQEREDIRENIKQNESKKEKLETKVSKVENEIVKAERAQVKELGGENIEEIKEINRAIDRFKDVKKKSLDKAIGEKNRVKGEEKLLKEQFEKKEQETQAIKQNVAEGVRDVIALIVEGESFDQKNVSPNIQNAAEEVVEQVTSHISYYENFVQQRKEEEIQAQQNLINDQDQDGISDTEELELGTNPFDSDADGDGFLDGIEKEYGFDPLNPEKEANVKYHDPRKAENVREDLYKVDRVEIIFSPESTKPVGLTLEGRGVPNSFVNIYIFSSPIIATTKTDSFGRWEYTLEKPLDSGSHEVYVAVTNNRGEIAERSEGFAFVKTADAVAAVTSLIDQREFKSPAEAFQRKAIIFMGIFILIAFGLAWLIVGYYSQGVRVKVKK